MPLFDLTQNSLCVSLISRVFVENISGNCLILQLPEAVILLVANKRLTKNLKKEMGNEMFIGGFEKD